MTQEVLECRLQFSLMYAVLLRVFLIPGRDRYSLAGGTWLGTGRGVPCLNNKNRTAEHSFSITEKQIWEIKEARIRARRNTRKRLSVLQRKNDR